MKVGDRFNPWKEFTGMFIPNWLGEREEISSDAKIIYARLCQFAGRDGKCFPKRDTLKLELGISIKRIDTAIGLLKDNSLIEVKQLGLSRPNGYYFLWHEWMVDARKLSKKAVADLPYRVTPEIHTGVKLRESV